jgi:hypothetical protein
MPKNCMVKYVGPKKVMHVPFPEDNKFPLQSMSDMHEMIEFPRGQMVELSPERAEALLAQSPGVFKLEAMIRPAQKPQAITVKVKPIEKGLDHAEGVEDSALEAQEPADNDL